MTVLRTSMDASRYPATNPPPPLYDLNPGKRSGARLVDVVGTLILLAFGAGIIFILSRGA